MLAHLAELWFSKLYQNLKSYTKFWLHYFDVTEAKIDVNEAENDVSFVYSFDFPILSSIRPFLM